MMQRRIQPIEDSNKTISSIAQERIRHAILEGVLPPGSRIDQNRLARDLNTSLVPVREALKKLESEGFVQIIPRRGAFVADVSLSDVEDLYHARRVIEASTGENAASKLTDDDLVQLRRLFKQVNDALKKGDYEAFTRLNRQFHFVIFDAVDSKYLSKVISGLWDLAERYRYRSALIKDRAEAIRVEHRAILDACEGRDGAALRAAIIDHLDPTLEDVYALVQSVPRD
jgi:DNA-binding GntR family transcriptional regulator